MTPCVGARVEMFFSKYFVSVRWGAKLEAVSQDEGESVEDLRRNEKTRDDYMPVGRRLDQGTAACDLAA